MRKSRLAFEWLIYRAQSVGRGAGVQLSSDWLPGPHFQPPCSGLVGAQWEGAVWPPVGQTKHAPPLWGRLLPIRSRILVGLEPPFFFLRKQQFWIWWIWLPLNLFGILISSELPVDSVHEFSFRLPRLAQRGEAHTCHSLLAEWTQCRSYFCDFSLARISIVSILMVSLGLAGAQEAFPKPLRAFSPCPSLAPVAA